MADRYIRAFRQIEKALKDQISIYEDGSSRFYSLVENISGEVMSWNDYAKVQEMFYKRYATRAAKAKDEATKTRLSKAQMYCVMNMQRVYLARKNKPLQKYYPKVTFSESADPELYEFWSRKRPFYSVLSLRIKNRMTIFACIGSILLMALLVLAVQMPFWLGFIFSVIAGLGFLYYAWHVLVPSLIEERLAGLAGKLDPVHYQYERKMHLHGRL